MVRVAQRAPVRAPGARWLPGGPPGGGGGDAVHVDADGAVAMRRADVAGIVLQVAEGADDVVPARRVDAADAKRQPGHLPRQLRLQHVDVVVVARVDREFQRLEVRVGVLVEVADLEARAEVEGEACPPLLPRLILVILTLLMVGVVVHRDRHVNTVQA